jgi:hypothetical protein
MSLNRCPSSSALSDPLRSVLLSLSSCFWSVQQTNSGNLLLADSLFSMCSLPWTRAFSNLLLQEWQSLQQAPYRYHGHYCKLFTVKTCLCLGYFEHATIYYEFGKGTETCKMWGFHGCDYEECRLVGYKHPLRTSQETHYVSAREPSPLILCKIWGFHGWDYEDCRPVGYKNPVHTSQEAHKVSPTVSSRLKLCKI